MSIQASKASARFCAELLNTKQWGDDLVTRVSAAVRVLMATHPKLSKAMSPEERKAYKKFVVAIVILYVTQGGTVDFTKEAVEKSGLLKHIKDLCTPDEVLDNPLDTAIALLCDSVYQGQRGAAPSLTLARFLKIKDESLSFEALKALVDTADTVLGRAGKPSSSPADDEDVVSPGTFAMVFSSMTARGGKPGMLLLLKTAMRGDRVLDEGNVGYWFDCLCKAQLVEEDPKIKPAAYLRKLAQDIGVKLIDGGLPLQTFQDLGEDDVWIAANMLMVLFCAEAYLDLVKWGRCGLWHHISCNEMRELIASTRSSNPADNAKPALALMDVPTPAAEAKSQPLPAPELQLAHAESKGEAPAAAPQEMGSVEASIMPQQAVGAPGPKEESEVPAASAVEVGSTEAPITIKETATEQEAALKKEEREEAPVAAPVTLKEPAGEEGPKIKGEAARAEAPVEERHLSESVGASGPKREEGQAAKAPAAGPVEQVVNTPEASMVGKGQAELIGSNEALASAPAVPVLYKPIKKSPKKAAKPQASKAQAPKQPTGQNNTGRRRHRRPNSGRFNRGYCAPAPAFPTEPEYIPVDGPELAGVWSMPDGSVWPIYWADIWAQQEALHHQWLAAQEQARMAHHHHHQQMMAAAYGHRW